MTLSSPVLLIVGVLVVAALIAAVSVARRRRSAALTAAGVTVDRGRGREAGTWLTIGGLAVLAVAFAGPAATVPVGRETGTVIVAIDVSNSMAATDVTPNRLEAAKEAAIAFINAQPRTVDIGVVGFDQGAITASLPGADRAAATGSVQSLRVSGGTSLGVAILASLTAITGRPVAIGPDGAVPDLGYWGSATIVLFSDGEDQGREGTAVAAATAAQNAGVHIDTVGVGTAAGTAVSVDDFQAHTALDEATLTAIAGTTGGSYHPASDSAEIAGVASTIDLRLTVTDEELPLAGAFIALALALLAGGAAMTVLRTGRLV